MKKKANLKFELLKQSVLAIGVIMCIISFWAIVLFLCMNAIRLAAIAVLVNLASSVLFWNELKKEFTKWWQKLLIIFVPVITMLVLIGIIVFIKILF